jgi:hypothetical protein
MRLRQLRLRIQTAAGPFGVTLDFPDGLVVVWADNSMGKSTCVKSILVALGLESMLTTSQSDLPLPPAVTHELTNDDGTMAHRVLESDVYLQIENSRGNAITVRRTIKGSRDKNLITVISGPALTSPERVAFESQDYFVSRPGAATRELGFHHFLGTFLGWSLPAVQTFEGGVCPLYLQCVFPYVAVEQTRGWASILPPIPMQLRIREAHKRATEFILDLDAHRIALRRQELSVEKTKLETAWALIIKQLRDLADSVGAVVENVPTSPTAKWPPELPPTLRVSGDSGWISVHERVEFNRRKVDELVGKEIPRTEEVVSVASTELIETEQELRNRESHLARLLDSVDMERQEARDVRQRLVAIDEDVQRNKDVQILRNLGSTHLVTVEQGKCPICHQVIQDSLIPIAAQQEVMSLDENIGFLTEQRRTYSAMLKNAEQIIFARERQINSLHEKLAETRDRIRSLRQTLISDGRLPSIEAIQSRLRLEASISRDVQALEKFGAQMTDLGSLSRLWRDIQGELAALPKEDATPDDKGKIANWTSVLRNQLTQYGFSSLAVSKINISSDTYRPEHEGFDLPTSISASDMIRMIWSYLHGMLELSRSSRTNHPGLLVFDEPKQQSTRDLSFAQLLRRASSAGTAKQQVVFFTSESRDRLGQHLASLPHTWRDFEGRILKPI